jgi:hypothetical protein
MLESLVVRCTCSNACAMHSHGHGHDHDHDDGPERGTPYDQSLDELDFLRSACAAAQRGQTARLEALLSRHAGRGLHGEDCGSGLTPLHYAAREGHLDCVRLLLRVGAVVDRPSRAGGATALHRAAFMGHCAVLKALLEAGADARLQDGDGETALHKAAAQGHAAAVELLLRAAPAAAAVRDRQARLPRERATGAADEGRLWRGVQETEQPG